MYIILYPFSILEDLKMPTLLAYLERYLPPDKNVMEEEPT